MANFLQYIKKRKKNKKDITEIKKLPTQNIGNPNITVEEMKRRAKLTGIDVDYENVDELLPDAIRLSLKNGYASTAIIQKEFKVKYSRAATIIDQMEYYGIIGPYNNSSNRDIIITADKLSTDFLSIVEQDNNSKVENNPPQTTESILEKVDSMSENGWEFEKFTADLLLKNGFTYAEATSGSNDYGVDVVASDERGVKYAIQCKCYSNKLNNKSVQEVIAGKTLYNCQVGVVFTNNYFTDNAKDIAKANNILLWDRNTLIMFIENSIS